MQTNNRILNDLAKVAGAAASSLTGVKGEVEALVRQQISRLMADGDMVPREEFDAVRAMAAKARDAQESLEARVAVLEKALNKATGKPPAKAAKKPAKKSSAKSKPA